MRYKRGIVLLLALTLAMGAGAACAEQGTEAPAQTVEPRVERIDVVRDPAHVTIGNTTALTGDFLSNHWGNATSDIDIRDLIWGYDLVEWDGAAGNFAPNPQVVRRIEADVNLDGDKTYTIDLYDDLKYSDGSAITAYDYAFSFLFAMSRQINALDGVCDAKEWLLGARAYSTLTAPLNGTMLERIDDGTADANGARLMERVDAVFRDGERIAYSQLIEEIKVTGGDGEPVIVTLTADEDGALSPETDDNLKNPLTVTADEAGYITDWHYERGVRVFADGSHPALEGVRVIDEHTLEITIDNEFLSFFYEEGLLACVPYPISNIAPGVEVRDDGKGAYLANSDPSAEAEADADMPVYTEALLRETLLDPETGFRRQPAVTSGAYRLVSFDGTTAELERNPYFKGDVKIDRLTYTLARNEDMVKRLATGELDILNKVTKASAISEAAALAESGVYVLPAEEDDIDEYHYVDSYKTSVYARTGLSFISFCFERTGVASRAVRQAIAYCMDRDQIARDYTGGYGVRVDGYYGRGQWMAEVVDGKRPYPLGAPEDGAEDWEKQEYEEALAAWQGLNLDGLNAYDVDLKAAERLLEDDGWTLNEDGIREKDGVMLDLVLIYPEGNEIAESLQENLAANLAEVGIRLALEPVPMEQLLRAYYRQPDAGALMEDGKRTVDMIYLASNFTLLYDPSALFTVEDGNHNWANTGSGDEELYRLALDMRHTEPGDYLEYMVRWIAFQERFNETLPMIPIYSNTYYDFYFADLENYAVGSAAGCGAALPGAWVYGGDPTEK